MPGRRATVLGVGIANIQEASKFQVVRKFKSALDVRSIESAGPEGRKAEVSRLHHHRGSHDARIHRAQFSPAVFRQNDHPPERHMPGSSLKEPARRHRVPSIEQNDVLRAVAIVLVKFLPQRNMVLPVHALDADRIRPCTLPFLFRPQDYDVVGVGVHEKVLINRNL